jgi:hypothetical protein
MLPDGRDLTCQASDDDHAMSDRDAMLWNYKPQFTPHHARGKNLSV